MNDRDRFVIFDSNESVLDSIFKDFVTFSLLSFSIYISQGSTWWTFITGLMFLTFLFSKISILMKRQKTFKNKKEIIEWAEKLKD